MSAQDISSIAATESGTRGTGVSSAWGGRPKPSLSRSSIAATRARTSGTGPRPSIARRSWSTRRSARPGERPTRLLRGAMPSTAQHSRPLPRQASGWIFPTERSLPRSSPSAPSRRSRRLSARRLGAPAASAPSRSSPSPFRARRRVAGGEDRTRRPPSRPRHSRVGRSEGEPCTARSSPRPDSAESLARMHARARDAKRPQLPGRRRADRPRVSDSFQLEGLP